MDMGLSLTTTGDPLSLTGAAVSSDFFSVLRSNAIAGRTFSAEEEQPGRGQVVVIGHGLWQRAFGANPNIIGQTLTLNSRNFTVVGIMPSGFQFPLEAELWVPLAWDDNERQTRSIHDYLVIARLKQNVSPQQAQAEMSTISSRLEQQPGNKGWGAKGHSAQDDLVGDVRPALLVLFCAVGFVLLIACANVANLMLSRGFNRQKEIALRTALGATRVRLVRQLLTESVLLALSGGLLGLLLAGWGIKMLVQLSSGSLPNAGDIGVDSWALGFTLVVSLGAGIVVGIVPAFQFTRANIGETLKQGSGRTVGSPIKQHTRKALVIEVALSLILNRSRAHDSRFKQTSARVRHQECVNDGSFNVMRYLNLTSSLLSLIGRWNRSAPCRVSFPPRLPQGFRSPEVGRHSPSVSKAGLQRQSRSSRWRRRATSARTTSERLASLCERGASSATRIVTIASPW